MFLTTNGVHSLLECPREKDVAELAETVGFPGGVSVRLFSVEIIPVNRRHEKMSGTRDTHHAGVGALQQARHQDVRKSEVTFFYSRRNRNGKKNMSFDAETVEISSSARFDKRQK